LDIFRPSLSVLEAFLAGTEVREREKPRSAERKSREEPRRKGEIRLKK